MEIVTDRKPLANLLKTRRTELKLEIPDVCIQLQLRGADIPDGTYQQWERGSRTPQKMQEISEILSEVLKIEHEKLMEIYQLQVRS